MLILEDEDIQTSVAPVFAGVVDDRPNRSAIFTIVRHDIFLETWLLNNTKHFDDAYVLFHQDNISQEERDLCAKYGAVSLQVHHDSECAWVWVTDTANKFATFLLNSHRLVAYTDIDEIVVDPKGKLKEIDGLDDFVRFVGLEIIQDEIETDLNWDKPIIGQRDLVYSSTNTCKVVVKKRASYLWDCGQHKLVSEPYDLFYGLIKHLPNLNPHIYLVHLHYFDKVTALGRSRARKNVAAFEQEIGAGKQAWAQDMEETNAAFRKKRMESKPLAGMRCSSFVLRDDPFEVISQIEFNGTVLNRFCG